MVRAITAEEMEAKFEWSLAESALHRLGLRDDVTPDEWREAFDAVEIAGNKWDAATFRADGEWEQANK